MYSKTPEELKQIIDVQIDKLEKDIKNSPWQIYPDIDLIDLIKNNKK